ncbi:hypothetical protein D1007_48856 [Hordeum vulgare]|nr:hypothetical protein D1007_48856 [Hordeum vulgare]
MTSRAGGLAPVPAVNPRAPLSKLPNAARPKKGRVPAKKNKAADGSGSSKPSRKRLAGCAMAAAATEGPARSLVETAADAQKVFEEMHQCVNDEAYMSTMGVRPTILIGLKQMSCISMTMSLRWTRMVRALSTHRKEEGQLHHGRHGSTFGRHGRHVFRCANTFA